MREINVYRAGDSVHAGDKALTRETPTQRGRVNRYVILQCNTEHKNVFLHFPGLKIAQIKILRNVVDDFGTLTT